MNAIFHIGIIDFDFYNTQLWHFLYMSRKFSKINIVHVRENAINMNYITRTW